MMERNYWLGFSVFPGIGPARFKKLLEKFGTAKNAWSAKQTSLKEVFGEVLSPKFENFREEFSIENYLKQLKEKEVWFVTLKDEDYPKLLRKIKNPPFILYGRGNPLTLDVRSMSLIAVVGARKTTQYGRDVTNLLTTQLVNNGFTIISGLAVGVDAISHMTALGNNGKTIAVLGCGVDCCNPVENQSIYNSIVQNGCIVSEFPLGMWPTKWTFPARNRIIAGLSQAVLVTEGAEDSGSLITAEFALKFGRKVFAVPGPITSTMSKGPYKLIAKGATLVASVGDILRELKISTFAKASADKQDSKVKDATEEELKILKLLENETRHFDEIIQKTGLNSSKIGSILSIMEIKGMIKSLNGGNFSL